MNNFSFSSYYELFIAFNLAYVGSSKIQLFVNNKVFGLTRKKKKMMSDIRTEIETLQVRKEDLTRDYTERLIDAERRLKKLEVEIPAGLQFWNNSFSNNYLLGGIFGLVILYLMASINNIIPSGFILNLSALTVLFYVLISIQIRYCENQLNVMWVLIAYSIINLVVWLFFYFDISLITVNIRDQSIIHLANLVLIFPFLLNFILSIFFEIEIMRDLKNIEKLTREDGDLLWIYGFTGKKDS
jgi:hypothetical protein